MKPLAIILIILVLAALVGVGYLYFTSNLTVTFSSVVATDPVDQAEAFDQVRTSVENETFIGTKYSAEQLAGPENYLFYTWTVHLENRSFLPADTIEIQITPMTGDVLLFGDPDEYRFGLDVRVFFSVSSDLGETRCDRDEQRGCPVI